MISCGISGRFSNGIHHRMAWLQEGSLVGFQARTSRIS
jgi:hypothetical protein